ncbi:MAG TPA: uroporphyrinogen decarboxylase, partial [Rhodospirillaceae bacterium]|nr:uroporphyrinogen decarboxylase [Rhodospirillaceae bacterium]
SEGFDRWVIAPNRVITQSLRARFPDTPVIGFPRGAGANISSYISQTGVNAVGLDQGVPLDWAVDHVQSELPIQGNLDPAYLLCDNEIILRKTKSILSSFSNGPHIFNLGHGVIKETDPEAVEYLVKVVRNYSKDEI